MQKQIVFLTSLLLAFTVLAACQDKKPASPPAQAQCKFSDGKTINIAYSSPRAKGRKIFGGLVPYGEVWRTGANEATTLVTSADVQVGGTTVPAGSYTIFTVPTADKWALIINKKTGEWGIPYKYESDELARVVDYEKLAERVRGIVASGHVRLVETLAERIAEVCLMDRRVHLARVRVEKLDIFADAVSAGVEIERRQSDLSTS